MLTEEKWIIRGDTASDYETSADAYKAVLISDIGTEMTLNSDYISWSVSGSDYISMKSPSGASSIMTAKQELPIGEHTITLKAEYEDEAGIKLEATKTITVEKRETSVPTQVNISGERALSLLTSQLPYEADYTAQVLDQFGMEMEDAVIEWSVSGDMIDGISIDNGKLTIGEDAASSVFTVTAKSAVNANASASIDVELVISQYPSKLYPTADVLFRMNNTDAKNVNGPDIEIRNLENSDRGFSGGLKFDISTLREAIEEDYPINSISIRFTTSVSNDGNLVLKELSNDWDESNSTLNSFANKEEIINEAINSDTVIVSNDEEGAFTLNRMTKGKRIYDGERGDNESLSDWQTTLDIKDYITKWISENPDKNEISFLLMANYNGTTANTVFSKDIDTTYANYSTLITKFPELEGNLGELYPAIVVDYGEETVVISSEVDTLPIPAHDGANTTQLKAVHYNPFDDTSDENIIWSISKFTDENGNVSASADGISISGDGTLSVTKDAKAGVVTVRAASSENRIVYAEKDITIAALTSQLMNGSFENTDDAMYPKNWTSYDPAIDDAHNGVVRYQMDQASETMLANIQESNDIDGYLSGSHSAEDPTGLYGKKTVRLTGAHGIDKDYEGKIYTSNAANNSTDGGPDLRVTTGVTYWISQDYHLEEFYQLNPSSLVGPYVGYEGFQGTTGRTSQFSDNWYIKDGSASTAYTTNGYDTLRKQITIPQNIDRLRINWGLTGSEGSIYYHNFRMAPQGIDTSKTAVDGSNVLKVTGAMSWTSDRIAVIPGRNYTYKLSSMSEASASGAVTISFCDAQGNELYNENIESAYTNTWAEKSGNITAPENAAYVYVKLANGTGSGSIWYDNVIFTETTASVTTYVTITGGNDMAVVPASGATANRYQYTARITDQYNNDYSGNVVWSLDKDYEGIEIMSNGALIVSDNAEAGTITIRAQAQENSEAYAENDTLDIRMSAKCPDGVSFDEQTGILKVSASAKGNEEIIISAEYNGLSASKTVKTLADATSLSISGSSRVTIPKSGSSTVTYSLLNQLGQKIDASSAQWSVTNTGSGVSIENGVLTVSRGATVQTITIQAEYNGMSAQKRVTLSNTSANTGSGGSGGGGGGGVPGGSGGTGSSLSGSSTGTGNNAMGNFGTGGTGTDEETVTVTNDSLIPQPDVSYFTQGMENIGGFSDIADVTWAQKAIVAMSAVDIVKGREEGKFFPNDSITRAEFVKMLIGMLEYAGRIDTADAECSFADVPEDAWYYSAVAAAVKNGIVTGVSETEFAPDANITRQDMAVMIDRAAKAANISLSNGAELIFTDEAAISDYALDAVKAMSKAGIINGFEDGSFSPMSNATRAQATVMLYRVAGGEN